MIRIELENGKFMDAELYPNVAPKTVENFLKLVDEKFFDGIVFHRIIKDFMVQCGGYKLNENKKLIYAPEVKSIKGEFTSNGFKNDLKHEVGVLSMARTMVKDSASSQFFICTATCPHLDEEYAGFGKLVGEESFKTLEEINNSKTVNVGQGLSDFPYPFVMIKSIRVI